MGHMLSLTTAQRDLLQLLLTTDAPIGAAALGQRLHLTPRQVHYGLRDIRTWLSRHHATLRHAPGIGVQVLCTPEQRERLFAELASQYRFQLILTPEQREQLLGLSLLATREPLTLNQLQHDLAVARTTVLKDLDAVEPWLQTFDLQIMRRQHRGCWVDGNELAKRQALAALLWGDVLFERPIMAVRPQTSIVFVLAQDAALLPIVGRVNTLVLEWDLAAAQKHIAWAEAELGARFTDEAIVPLALGVALQLQRVHARQWVSWAPETLRWIQAQVVWPVAARMAAQFWPDLPDAAHTAETAAFALQLLCGARDEPWRSDLGDDQASHELIDALLDHIACAYAVPELTHDQLLRDGLEVLILPACARQRFRLWTPPRAATDTYTERYAVERRVAAQLAGDVAAATGTTLPPDALDDLILLLRAAVVRARPERARRVLVVCPSGMATTQLLIARLKARFPRLGTFEVLPMRELTAERVADSDLIITTVPLTLSAAMPIDVIHVHPMLKPEDIAALTQWMA
jgi:mannitol operon transcriptional antiterminator